MRRLGEIMVAVCIVILSLSGLMDSRRITKLENPITNTHETEWFKFPALTNGNQALTSMRPVLGFRSDGVVVWTDEWELSRQEQIEQDKEWNRFLKRLSTNNNVVTFTNYNGKAEIVWTNDAKGRPRL